MSFGCLYRVAANYISPAGDIRSIRLMVHIVGVDDRERRGDPRRVFPLL